MSTKTKKRWLIATCRATPESVVVAQNAFAQIGSIGIHSDDGEIPEGRSKFADDQIIVSAYFEPEHFTKEQLNNLWQGFFSDCELEPLPLSFAEIEQQDWQKQFVASCTTITVEPEIYIVPSFEITQFKKDHNHKLFIEMDPENAFGTGQHQTTQLCLTSLAKYLNTLPKEDLLKLCGLDVGCGSGILSILMKKLGVAHVCASEIDESALETARLNGRKNDVDIDFIQVEKSPSYKAKKYHLVVANILAPVLIEMATDIVDACKSNGRIILSGILLNQAADVIDTYEHLGAKLIEQNCINDWCALVFVRGS